MIKRFFIILVVNAFIYGCVNHDVVVGTYQGLFPFAEIKLILNADGTYEQICKYNKSAVIYEDGKLISLKGKWRLMKEVPIVPFYKIQLDDFWECFDWYNVNKPNSNPKTFLTSYEVSKYWGPVRIIIRDDLGIIYKKTR